MGREKFAILTEIAIYLGNSTRHGYCGSLIVSHG